VAVLFHSIPASNRVGIISADVESQNSTNELPGR
jgi:hypothetical protein